MFTVDGKRKGSKGGKNATANDLDSKLLKSQVDDLKEKGNTAFKNEDFDKAVQFYKEGLQLDPNNVTLNCNLSQAYLTRGEFLDAEVHAVVTLAHQPDSVKGFYRATKAAMGMEKKDRALYYIEKGLSVCPNAEELKNLYEELKNFKKGAVCDEKKASGKKNINMVTTIDSDNIPDNISEKSDKGIQNKKRSQSAGGPPTEKSTEDAHSTSVSRMTDDSAKSKKKSSKNVSPPSDVQDHFLEMLKQVKNELPADKKSPQMQEREAMQKTKEGLLSVMKQGSEAFTSGLARHASEKYKTALDLMSKCNIEVFGMSNVDHLVLKYSLSVTWIDTLNYGNIIQSIGYLTEIETNHAAKLPAVYYGLGHAFFRLNRRKTAVTHLEKGFSVIEKNLRITAHPWPGTMNTIQETTKEGLKESLYKLINNCKIYQKPDAICRYKLCLTVSTHICPSEYIHYSDPDYVGYVVIKCQEHCQIIFHLGCWKDYKEKKNSLKKITDKDMLGQPCLTSDCVTDDMERSLIFEIEVIGDDGNVKSRCLKTDTKQDYKKKNKKKKSEKIEKPKERPRIVPRRDRQEPSECSSVKKKKKKITQDFERDLKALDDLRSQWAEKSYWDPRKDDFGKESVSSLKTFGINEAQSGGRISKDFIFTYFYEYLKADGPQKNFIIEQKGRDMLAGIPGVEEDIVPDNGMCDFLLQSLRFAAVDDYICLSHQLSSVYLEVQIETGESTLFILTTDQKIPQPVPIMESEGETSGLNTRNTNCLSSPIDTTDVSTNAYYSESEDDPHSEIYDGSGDEYDYSDVESEVLDDRSPSSNGHDVNGSPHDIYSPMFNGEPIPSTSSWDPPTSICIIDIPTTKKSIPTDKEETKYAGNGKNSPYPITQPLIMVDETIQTDGPDYCKEYEAIRTLSEELKREVNFYKDLNKKQNEDIEAANNFIKDQENRTALLKSAHENDLVNLQKEIFKKNETIELLKKKHLEYVEKLQKRLEEEKTKVKNGLEVMNDYSTAIDTLQTSNTSLEDQLRKLLVEILNTRKFFAAYIIDAYLSKCKDKLESLAPVLIFLQGTTLKCFPTLKGRLTVSQKEWLKLIDRLKEKKEFLQVQYDILSQQIKNNNVGAEHIVRLEFPELPSESNDLQLCIEEFVIKALQLIEADEKEKEKQKGDNNEEELVVESAKSALYAQPALGAQAALAAQFALSAQSGEFPPVNGPNAVPGHLTPPSQPTAASFVQGQSLLMGPPAEGFQSSHHFRYFPSTNYYGGSSPAIGALNASSGIAMPAPATVPTPLPPINKNFSLLKSVCADHLANPLQAQNSGPKGLSLSKGKQVHHSTESLPNDDTRGKGAISKKRDKVSGLTPIESTSQHGGSWETPYPSKSHSADLKLAQIRWCYQQLLQEMRKQFPTMPEVVLSECLVSVREKNGHKLSGLSISSIIQRVEKTLEEKSSKKTGNLGIDKFGDIPWGEVKSNGVKWHKEDPEEECAICHMQLDHGRRTALECKHSCFHSECIRKWININSTCPICREFSKLVDEFPPLKN